MLSFYLDDEQRDVVLAALLEYAATHRVAIANGVSSNPAMVAAWHARMSTAERVISKIREWR